MRSSTLIFPLVIAAALSACSKSSEPPKQPEMRPDQTVFKDQVRALEKAKTVDQTLQQDAQHTRDAIERQETLAP